MRVSSTSSRWRYSTVVILLFLLPSCATEGPITPMFVATNFSLKEIDVISVLPAIDDRPGKEQPLSYINEMTTANVGELPEYGLLESGYEPNTVVAKSILEGTGYDVELLHGSDVTPIQASHLNPQAIESLVELGPADRRWILVVALTGLESGKSIRIEATSTCTGTMYDRVQREVIWHHQAVGEIGIGFGLLTAALPLSQVEQAAVRYCARKLYRSIPPPGKGST